MDYLLFISLLCGQIYKIQGTNIKHKEINIMSIINDNTFNLHNRLLDNENRYRKVTHKSKFIGVARKLISANYREF